MRNVQNTEDINAFVDGLFTSLFSSCLKKILTTICSMELANIQLSEECDIGRQNFAKKFAERPPAKTCIQAAGYSDGFATNFAQSFHPVDKHNSVKKRLVQAFELFPWDRCHQRLPWSYRSISHGVGSSRGVLNSSCNGNVTKRFPGE